MSSMARNRLESRLAASKAARERVKNSLSLLSQVWDNLGLRAASNDVRSGAMVIVDKADDVVLAEIASALHLDQLQVDLARIFQTVRDADRNIDRFILVQGLDLRVNCDPRRSPHDNPVLGPMVML